MPKLLAINFCALILFTNLIACNGPRPLIPVQALNAHSETALVPGPDLGSGHESVPAAQLDPEELTMLGLINQHRDDFGLPPLRLSPTLFDSSRWMSGDMAARNYFSHIDSLGRSCFKRMDDFNFNGSATQGENIACGNAGAAATFQQWLNSPSHNANMLDSRYNRIGIARAYSADSTYGWYWTTDLGQISD